MWLCRLMLYRSHSMRRMAEQFGSAMGGAGGAGGAGRRDDSSDGPSDMYS